MSSEMGAQAGDSNEIDSVGDEEDGNWRRAVANFDAGETIAAIPSNLNEKLGIAPNEVSARTCETASGETLFDAGSAAMTEEENLEMDSWLVSIGC